MMTMAAASTEMKMATVAVDCLQMFAMVRRYLLWEASLMAWMITSCLSRMAMLVSMVTRLHKVRMDSPSPPKQSMRCCFSINWTSPTVSTSIDMSTT